MKLVNISLLLPVLCFTISVETQSPDFCNIEQSSVNYQSQMNNAAEMSSSSQTSPFVDLFLKSFQESDTMGRLFENSIQASKRLDFYDAAVQNANKFEMSDPSTAAESVVKAISSMSDKLTPTTLAKVTGIYVEKFLRDHELLTGDNVEQLSRSMAKAFEKETLNCGSAPSSMDYLKAYSDAVLEFLTPFHIINSETSENLANYFNQEILALKN